MATVLIAALGDSPVAVTAMFDLLQEEVKNHNSQRIDKLEVFCYLDENDNIGATFTLGYEDLILRPLKDKCEVVDIPLLYADMDGEEAVYDFLRKLHTQLDMHQKNGDIVYLSLASGRKSGAALMALLAPLFPCVKQLYHILDMDEDHLWSTARLYDLPAVQREHILFPPHERVKLINIPYGEKQHLSEEMRSLLYHITDEQIDELWEKDAELAEVVEYYNPLAQGNDEGGLLTVKMTENAIEQYRKLLHSDVNRARKFTICFQQMRYAKRLMAALRTNKEDGAHDRFYYKPLHRTFHFYKSHEHATERAVYHTEPQDIASTSAAFIKDVVISELEIEVSKRYRSLKEIVSSPKFSLEGQQNYESAFPEESGSLEHILIVPLATSPMVATQLYQLSIDRGYKVHSVILVYTQHEEVRRSVDIALDAFARAKVPCETVSLKGWDDVDTLQACIDYQKLLEQTIRKVRQQNPSCQIDLAISGGRKAMAAMAIFAAQQQGIRRVVHTLIIDEHINDKVSKETTIKKLEELAYYNDKRERDDRLFLRAYQDNKNSFILFKIPVIPTKKG